jgi:hypothetical protein
VTRPAIAGPVLALDLLNNFSWRGRAFRAGWLSRQGGLLRGLSETGLGRRRAPESASLPGTRHGRHWSEYSQVETCCENNMKPLVRKDLKDLEGGGDFSFTSLKKQPTTLGPCSSRAPIHSNIFAMYLYDAFRLGYVADNFERNIVVCLAHRLRLANGVD